MTTRTRRTVAATLVAASLAPLLLRVPNVAGQPTKPRRIGYLASQSPASAIHLGFVEGLRELGWIEGQNIAIEFRFAEGDYERLLGFAEQLVRLGVEVLVAHPRRRPSPRAKRPAASPSSCPTSATRCGSGWSQASRVRAAT